MQEGQPQNQAGWVFTPGGDTNGPAGAPPGQGQIPPTPDPAQAPAPNATQQDEDGIHWTASEYIARQKDSSWFMLLVGGTVLVGAVIYFITRDFLSVLVVVVFAVVVGMLGAREPKARDYSVSGTGIRIGEKFYPYSKFKSFSILHEDAMGFVSLMPTQRFMPPLALYYAPDDEEGIVDVLADFLPYEERDHDFVERLSRKVRF